MPTVRPELFLEGERSRMARNDVAQPANFALQIGLVGEELAASFELETTARGVLSRVA